MADTRRIMESFARVMKRRGSNGRLGTAPVVSVSPAAPVVNVEPTPITVEPTPITVEVAPTPIVNQVEVEPTPVQVQNQVDVTLIAEALSDGLKGLMVGNAEAMRALDGQLEATLRDILVPLGKKEPPTVVNNLPELMVVNQLGDMRPNIIIHCPRIKRTVTKVERDRSGEIERTITEYEYEESSRGP